MTAVSMNKNLSIQTPSLPQTAAAINENTSLLSNQPLPSRFVPSPVLSTRVKSFAVAEVKGIARNVAYSIGAALFFRGVGYGLEGVGYGISKTLSGAMYGAKYVYYTASGSTPPVELPPTTPEPTPTVQGPPLPANLSSLTNLGAFSAVSYPVYQATSFTAGKIADYTSLSPSQRMLAYRGANLSVPFISAYACNVLGFDINPYDILSGQIKFMILSTAIVGVATGLTKLAEYLEDEDSSQNPVLEELYDIKNINALERLSSKQNTGALLQVAKTAGLVNN